MFYNKLISDIVYIAYIAYIDYVNNYKSTISSFFNRKIEDDISIISNLDFKLIKKYFIDNLLTQISDKYIQVHDEAFFKKKMSNYRINIIKNINIENSIKVEVISEKVINVFYRSVKKFVDILDKEHFIDTIKYCIDTELVL